MPTTIKVDLGERAYEIRIGRQVVPGFSLETADDLRALIVSDSNVDKLYSEKCEAALQARGVETTRTAVPAGETSKDLKVIQQLLEEAVDAGLDRGSVVVALGGGMVGDLAGFLAAVLLRGVKLIQVPTTLLAMVDSSVGGKTGVNLPQGKNLAGAFYQPVEVAVDLATLETVPEREYVSGLAEVVKYGVVWDAVLFEQIENSVEGIMSRDLDVLEGIIARCCEIKAEVVSMDEREAGVRAVLNFGHTLGHAVENVAGYGELLHGEAVSIGMAYACGLSQAVKEFPEEESKRVSALLERLGLAVRARDRGLDLSWDQLRASMAADKKTRHSVLRFVLAENLGSVVFGCEVPEAVLEKVFTA